MELIEQVINRQNMMRALNQVRQNKGSAGVDRMPVSELYDQKRPTGGTQSIRIHQQWLSGYR